MRAARLAPILVLLAPVLAGRAAAQTADRYGYAPAEAQIPMRQALDPRAAPAQLRGSATVAASVPPPALRTASAPPLRLLSWPGKGAPLAAPALRAAPRIATAAPGASPPARAPGPIASRSAVPEQAAVRRQGRRSQPSAPSALRRPDPAPPRQAFASAPPARYAPSVQAPAYASTPSAPSAAAGVAPAPRPTFAPPPAPADPVQGYAAAAPTGVGLPPPVRPWYQRYPEAAGAASASAPSSGVGASLAPGTPAAPPPATPLGAYAAPSAGAAPAPVAYAAPPAGGGARYYSLHKPYGYTPDPAPIPPQFFGATADLSTPETPEPARATLTANAASAKAAVNAARLQQGGAD